MEPALPELPRWWIWVAGAVGVAALVGVALLGNETGFREQLLGKTLELGATVAFAFAGLTALAAGLRKRLWTKRTRDLAVLRLERAEGELGSLAQQIYGVLVGALPPARREEVLEVRPAFRVPISDVQRGYWYAANKVIGDQLEALRRSRESPVTEAEERESPVDHLNQAVVAAQETIDYWRRRVEGEAGSEAPDSRPQPLEAPERDTRAAEPVGGYATEQAGGRSASAFEAFRKFGADYARGSLSSELMATEALVDGADEQTAALRSQWSGVAEAISELAGLLDTEPANRLLSGALRLRDAIWVYEPSIAPRSLSVNAEQRSRELIIWKTDRAVVAYRMVVESLLAGWEMLESLDNILDDDRMRNCEAAKRHVTAKRYFDSIAALERDALELSKAFAQVSDTSKRIKRESVEGPA